MAAIATPEWVDTLLKNMSAHTANGAYIREHLDLTLIDLIRRDPTNKREIAGEKFARCALFMTHDTDTTVSDAENRINQRRRLWAWLEPYLWKSGAPSKGQWHGQRADRLHCYPDYNLTKKKVLNKVRPGSEWVADALRVVHKKNSLWIPSSAAYLITYFYQPYENWQNMYVSDVIQLEDPAHDVPDAMRALRRLRQLCYEYSTRGTFFTYKLSLKEMQNCVEYAASNNNIEAIMWVVEILGDPRHDCKSLCEGAARGGHVHLIREYHNEHKEGVTKCQSRNALIGCLLQGYQASAKTLADELRWIEALRVLRVEMGCDWGDATCTVAVRKRYLIAYNWTQFAPPPALFADTFLHHLMEMGCRQIGLVNTIMAEEQYSNLRWFLSADTGGGSRGGELSKRPCYCNMPTATIEFINWCREPVGPPPEKICR